jgi:hypothetical protein
VGVHLGHAGAAGGLRVLDQGQGAPAVLAQLGQELRSGEEHRAAQAGVGVRTALLHRQPAVAVRQGLGGQPVARLGPLRLAQRPVRVDWNQDPKPFIWTKTAEDILQSLSKYIAKISDAGH